MVPGNKQLADHAKRVPGKALVEQLMQVFQVLSRVIAERHKGKEKKENVK